MSMFFFQMNMDEPVTLVTIKEETNWESYLTSDMEVDQIKTEDVETEELVGTGDFVKTEELVNTEVIVQTDEFVKSELTSTRDIRN